VQIVESLIDNEIKAICQKAAISDNCFLFAKTAFAVIVTSRTVPKAGHGNDGVWKAWKAKKPAFHPSHTPWKSLNGITHFHGLYCWHISRHIQGL
jgi:hypothetical protein